MYIICSDLEGVFTPEIWINISKHTGGEELKLTTRDISDYDVLMKRRLALLEQHRLTLHDIRKVISQLSPLPGANEFIDWLRTKMQVIIVSDTFTEFAQLLILQLGKPTLLCHNLTVDEQGFIRGYNLRQKDAKRKVVEALQNLNYQVIAIGDSYNDIAMLRRAEYGILFNPPRNVVEEHGDLPVATSYDQLREMILSLTGN